MSANVKRDRVDCAVPAHDRLGPGGRYLTKRSGAGIVYRQDDIRAPRHGVNSKGMLNAENAGRRPDPARDTGDIKDRAGRRARYRFLAALAGNRHIAHR